MLNIKREITDLKEKIKYIKDIQQSNKKELKRKFVLAEYEDKRVFLDVTKLKGTKYFFHIPYNQYLINNDWKHQAFTMFYSLELILKNIKIFDAEIKEYSKDEALKYLKDNFGIEE